MRDEPRKNPRDYRKEEWIAHGVDAREVNAIARRHTWASHNDIHHATVEPCESYSNELSSEQIVKGIRRATRMRYSAEEKICIVLDGLRGEMSIAELCRREVIPRGLYCSWSKDFLEAGERRLAGDTACAATSDEVKALRREAQELKEVVAEQALELRLLKKHDRVRRNVRLNRPASG
jgi:transposase